MHISASVFTHHDESGLHQDYEHWLEKLAPHEPVDQYRHNDTGEDNADAHLKRQIMVRLKLSSRSPMGLLILALGSRSLTANLTVGDVSGYGSKLSENKSPAFLSERPAN